MRLSTKQLSRIILSSLAVVILFSACKKEEEQSSPQEENRAPGEFSITTTVELNSVLISWTPSIDPDGDEVFYALILEGDTVGSLLTQTQYEILDLDYYAEYSGSITAIDSEGKTRAVDFDFFIPMMQNQPPSAFDLLSPGAAAVFVATPINFSWNAATDPDGDQVTYELLMDTNSQPSTSLGAELSSPFFTFTASLPNSTTHYWQVIARDQGGAETLSEIRSFTSTSTMTLANGEPGWISRSQHKVQHFNGRMWLTGGTHGAGNYLSDIWSSADGINWTEELEMAPWGGRSRNSTVVFDNKLWMVGGMSNPSAGSEFNDVWYTEDGVNWLEATPQAAFEPRRDFDLLSFDGYIWMFGGADGVNSFSQRQVWRSQNGIDWELVTDDAGINFTVTQMVVFDNKIWRICSYSESTIYSSTDGVNWNLELDQAPFGERLAHTCAVHDGKIWLISGSDTAINEFFEIPDIWSSEDGVNWELVSSSPGFAPVAHAEAVSFDDKLWLLGGGNGNGDLTTRDDVWVLD